MGNQQRRRVKGHGEQDVHTGWRRVLTYTDRAGVTSKIKRSSRRRERREGRREVEQMVEQETSSQSVRAWFDVIRDSALDGRPWSEHEAQARGRDVHAAWSLWEKGLRP